MLQNVWVSAFFCFSAVFVSELLREYQGWGRGVNPPPPPRLVLNTLFTLNNCLFGSVKLTNNADSDKHKYSRYDIGFDSPSEFLFTDGRMGKNVITFGEVHIDYKNKDILTSGEGIKD